MEYAEIRIIAAGEAKEAIMDRMTGMGAIGFRDDDADITGYFRPDRSPAELCAEIELFRKTLKEAGLDPSFAVSSSVLPDRDWNEEWKKGFVPIDVGQNLTIIPSWLAAETGRVPVIIDPGMVFGTGHHETTRTCLSLIEKISLSGEKKSFLDIGTGTGILAIGASRLGYERVVAVDIDPLAVDAARRNAEANNLANIEVLEGTVSSVNGTYDAIAANLLVEILTAIAPELASRLNSGGTAALSGLLTGQEDEVIRAMTSAGLRLLEKIEDGKWVTLLMRK